MESKRLLNMLHLKLMGYETRIKDLEAQVAQLTVKLAGANAQLIADKGEEKST